MKNPKEIYATEVEDVEDIMCDQVILSSELDVKINHGIYNFIIFPTKLRVVVTVLTREVFPTVIAICFNYIKNNNIIINNVNKETLSAIIAYLGNSISRSLASVQRGISYPLHLRNLTNGHSNPSIEFNTDKPEKCVECIVLHEPDEELLGDVIFVHGLHGSVEKTWKQGLWRHEKHKLRNERAMGKSKKHVSKTKTRLKRPKSDNIYFLPSELSKQLENLDENVKKNNEITYSNCWPKEWIPEDCPGVRIIAINYTTDPYLWRPVWIKKKNRSNLVERSQEIVNQLINLGVGKKPIIWVGHSKGGLFIKQIIVSAWETNDSFELKQLHLQTKGIMFYSVPHKGSLLADITLPLLSRSVELTEIQRNCSFLLNLHEKFLRILNESKTKPEIFSFIETSFTLMSFLYLKIVAFDSADPDLGIRCGVPLDHREICKPAGRDCFLYVELINLINNALLNEQQ